MECGSLLPLLKARASSRTPKKGGFTMNGKIRRQKTEDTSQTSYLRRLKPTATHCSLLIAHCFLSLTLTLTLILPLAVASYRTPKAQELPYTVMDITSGNSVHFYPEFSHDGKQIVFSSKPVEGNYFTDMNLWIMDADGKNRRRITSKNAMYLQPTFTPDGEKVVFISNLEDGLWDIWSMKINGSGLTRLTKDNQKEFFPIVTSDGKNVIFIGRYFGTDSVFI